ncbi:MAG TPA: hypothetical protein PLS00_09300 [Niabella sp.]|nr:hypothetical protein [Niabella sp.]
MVSYHVVGCCTENRSKCIQSDGFYGFGAYETAWTWLQKLRSAKVRIITSKKTLYVLPKNSASP